MGMAWWVGYRMAKAMRAASWLEGAVVAVTAVTGHWMGRWRRARAVATEVRPVKVGLWERAWRRALWMKWYAVAATWRRAGTGSGKARSGVSGRREGNGGRSTEGCGVAEGDERGVFAPT